MMKKLVLLCSFFAAVGMAHAEKIEIVKTIERNGIVYKIHATEPFTGEVYQNYPNGKKKTLVEYADGLKHGTEIHWFQNKRKEDEWQWKHGVRDGLQEEWYDNGQLAFRGVMKDGQPDGMQQGWYPDGQEAFQIVLYDGAGEGRDVVINWNTTLEKKYEDVAIEGKWIEWDKTGRLERDELYKKNRLIQKTQ